MNSSEKPRRFGILSLSSEAILGIGITVAELGILCLLLGWAEYMRSVPAVAWIWLALGAVLFALGGLAAISVWFGTRPPIQPDHASRSSLPQDEVQSVPDSEEQRY